MLWLRHCGLLILSGLCDRQCRLGSGWLGRGLRPQPTCLIEEGSHLRWHASEPRAGPDDDRVVVGDLGHRSDGRILVQFEVGALGDRFRDCFGNALDVDLRACAARAFGDCYEE